MGIAVLAVPVAVFVFVPFFRRLNVNTAYEYLERRFDVKVRLMASFIYVVTQFLKMGIVIYLPALALETVTGIDIQLCILVMGILCTVYTVLGGIEAVIWTDVIQVIVLLGGALICMLIMIFDLGSDLPKMAAEAWDAGKFSFSSPGIGFTEPTLVVVVLSMMAVVAPYVSDQTVIQRYLTTKTEKDTQVSLWANALITIPAAIIFFGLGTLLYMYYSKNTGLLDPGMANDSVFPWFILNQLPSGISGLLIAGVFAAAMSSLDSSLNSSSSAIINDFVVRFKSSVSEYKRLYYARALTIFFGVIGTATAIVMSIYDIKSLWDQFSMMIGLVAGGLFACFLLAAFTKRTNSLGVIVGVIVSAVVMFYIKTQTNLHFFLYITVSASIAYIVAYFVSIFTGQNRKDISGLTIYDMIKR